ncbi:MAG TPA: nucleoside-diphosphate kinase [Candidatus Saccharimonadales bacterium]|nr:nucleoside-diphosphate kinase [Candidatus Saccharimonadales bacterium]
MERTLVVVKPDGVQRGLTGEVIRRLEQTGLKVVGLKLTQVSQDMAEQHYPADREEMITGIGQKSLDDYKKLNLDAKAELGTDDPKKIGELIRSWLADYLTSGPVVALVVEGPHAIELVRKLVGNTLPLSAAPGTIRGDFSYDSAYLGNTRKRPIKNLVHASGNAAEAEFEVPLWFKTSELVSYRRSDEAPME